MANVYFKSDVEVRIPDAAFAYAKKLQDAEDEEKAEAKAKNEEKTEADKD